MAKLTIQRFPDPPLEYDFQNFNEVIRLLEQLIQQLNTTYTLETLEEGTRRSWYFSAAGD